MNSASQWLELFIAAASWDACINYNHYAKSFLLSVDCEVPLLLKNIIDVNHNKNNFGSIAVEILQNSNLQKNNFISYARNINIFFMHDKIKHFEHFQNNCKLYHK